MMLGGGELIVQKGRLEAKRRDIEKRKGKVAKAGKV